MQRCNGKTKAGAPCRAPASSGGLCFFHANPDKAHILGQIGGRKNGSQLLEPPALGSLSAGDLRDILPAPMQEGRKSLDTDATWSRGQEEGGRGMEAPPGDVHTPGIGDGAEDRNHGSGEDGKA